ncbi:MAG: class D beta-lactamase [Ectothiorhodospiraceae bacterium]|nr:class D beta-lactamase [Ectothiorhodospiraceae bacterium]
MYRLISILAVLLFTGQASAQKAEELRDLFGDYTYSFLHYDLQAKMLHMYTDTLPDGSLQAMKAYSPCSTFKIPNSMIALESGAISGPDEMLEWDGEKRFYDKWNQDHNLRMAFKHSAVWFYQEMARRVGKENMQEWLNKLNYGDKNIGDDVTTFWLEKGLKISANQQWDFLVRLALNELPFSRETMDTFRNEIFPRGTVEGGYFCGKTGTSLRTAERIGWYVGWVERNGEYHIFVTNILGPEATGRVAEEITIKVLHRLHVLKGKEPHRL